MNRPAIIVSKILDLEDYELDDLEIIELGPLMHEAKMFAGRERLGEVRHYIDTLPDPQERLLAYTVFFMTLNTLLNES